MRVGVLDIGSNTIRLLVADVDDDRVATLDTAKVRLGLGAEIERRGGVSAVHVAEAARAVRRMSERARRHRVEALDVFVTAPGRQSSNAAELVATLSRAAGQRVRVLSTDEEARLAYGGAVATAPVALSDAVAVCDVGGASTEIAVGAPAAPPTWIRSVDLGAVRLTTRVVAGKRITGPELVAARAAAAGELAGVRPPRAGTALAVGGSARAARRLVGPRLGAEELRAALRVVAAESPRTVARTYGVDRARAEILAGGLVLLEEVQLRLGVPLHVCDGGIREGAVLASVDAALVA